MRIEKKKVSKDYGLYCFRLSKEDRETLNFHLEKAKDRLNRGRKADEYVVTGNQILFEAIMLGLPLVKKDL